MCRAFITIQGKRELVKYQFNGHWLYSDTVTMDSKESKLFRRLFYRRFRAGTRDFYYDLDGKYR